MQRLFAGSMAAIYRNVPHSTLAYTVYPKAETFVFAMQVKVSPFVVILTCTSFPAAFWFCFVLFRTLRLCPSPLTFRNAMALRTTAAAAVFTAQMGRGQEWLNATLRGDPMRSAEPAGRSFNRSSRSFSTRFWAGYITLFGATLLTHPLDTLRVKISVDSKFAEVGFIRG